MFINRDLSYLYLPSACDLSKRFFLKSLSMNVLFGNIDRKIGQVFPWGINTLTFPPKEWGAEPTPHSPPSREGSGGGGWGREPTPHSGVIYSYIHILGNLFISFLIYSKERRIAVFPKTESLSLVVLKRAPHYHVLENRVFFKFLYSKERRRAVFQTMGIFKVCILKIAPHGVFLKLEYF